VTPCVVTFCSVEYQPMTRVHLGSCQPMTSSLSAVTHHDATSYSLSGPCTAVLPITAFSEGPLWTTSGAGFKLGRKPLAVFQPTAHIGGAGGGGDEWMQQAGARNSSLEMMRRLCYMGSPVHFQQTVRERVPCQGEGCGECVRVRWYTISHGQTDRQRVPCQGGGYGYCV
jgi:hypothetical protein